MEDIRFERFTLLIDGIHKCIHKIKLDAAPTLGIKGVHVFWVYELSRHPKGLTAAEIASASRIDRSLVSREIAALTKDGYIRSQGGTGKNRYNDRFTLTERGMALASTITELVTDVQSRANAGIGDEELDVFYSVLERLMTNFEKIAESRDGTAAQAPENGKTN